MRWLRKTWLEVRHLAKASSSEGGGSFTPAGIAEATARGGELSLSAGRKSAPDVMEHLLAGKFVGGCFCGGSITLGQSSLGDRVERDVR